MQVQRLSSAGNLMMMVKTYILNKALYYLQVKMLKYVLSWQAISSQW